MKWKECLKKWDLIVRCNWVLSSILDTSAFAPNVPGCAIEFYPRNWKCLHLLPCTHTCPQKMQWIHLIQYHPALLRRLRNLYWNTSTSPDTELKYVLAQLLQSWTNNSMTTYTPAYTKTSIHPVIELSFASSMLNSNHCLLFVLDWNVEMWNVHSVLKWNC